jgi:hypothetical protein
MTGDPEASGLTRRRFLASAGAAAAAGTAGARPVGATGEEPGPRPSSAADPPDAVALDHEEARDVRGLRQRFEQASGDRVDGVEDLDLDPTAQESVTARLEAAADRGEVVELPPGDYLFSSPVETSASGWGVVGGTDGPVRFHTPRNGNSIVQRGGGTSEWRTSPSSAGGTARSLRSSTTAAAHRGGTG